MRKCFLMLLMACLAACAPGREEAAGTLVGTDISGSPIGREFELTDHHGAQRHLSDFKGKVVALFFGYTHCPDICPTTMADLASALKLLGSHGKEVQVLFVTLDPQRDTAEVLGRYVPAFDPSFLGLRGDESATQKVAQDFRIFYARQQSASKGGYSIDHSAGMYLLDKRGAARVYMNYGENAKNIANDISVLLNE